GQYRLTEITHSVQADQYQNAFVALPDSAKHPAANKEVQPPMGVPELAQVLVGYEHGLAEFPVVLGNLFHPQNKQQAKYTTPQNQLKGLQTAGGNNAGRHCGYCPPQRRGYGHPKYCPDGPAGSFPHGAAKRGCALAHHR
nr:hypothetical protein [Tanacetum cinerariifolium]